MSFVLLYLALSRVTGRLGAAGFRHDETLGHLFSGDPKRSAARLEARAALLLPIRPIAVSGGE